MLERHYNCVRRGRGEWLYTCQLRERLDKNHEHWRMPQTEQHVPAHTISLYDSDWVLLATDHSCHFPTSLTGDEEGAIPNMEIKLTCTDCQGSMEDWNRIPWHIQSLVRPWSGGRNLSSYLDRAGIPALRLGLGHPLVTRTSFRSTVGSRLTIMSCKSLDNQPFTSSNSAPHVRHIGLGACEPRVQVKKQLIKWEDIPYFGRQGYIAVDVRGTPGKDLLVPTTGSDMRVSLIKLPSKPSEGG